MNSSTANYPERATLSPLRTLATHDGIPPWKRMLDLSCILLASPFLVPLGFFVSALIKCVSSGPILFKQERIGYRGNRFYCFKFRTMRCNAETHTHKGHLQDLIKSNKPMVKLDARGDSRLIRGAVLLRSLGIDEMPQLINVLRGEMSLVGPRPCIPYEYESFQPRHRRRCDTLPGLTGWWQVNGKNRTTFERMMDLDLEYVEKKSLGMDLKILLMTVPAILGQVWDVKVRQKAAKKRKPEQE